MAENDRNRGNYRSSNQDFNEGNQYGRESYDDRGNSGSYGSRYESNYGNQNRYGNDYGEGSTYNSGQMNESDYNRGSRYGRENDRDFSGYGNENRSRQHGSSQYSGLGDTGSGFGSSRYDRNYQNYNPGGYMNYGGGSGYGGSYFGGGHGGSTFGRNFGSSNSGSLYGNSSFDENSRGNKGSFGSSDRGRWDNDQNRGYGSVYGNSYGSSSYGQNAGNRGQERGWWDKTSDEVSSWFGDEDAERRRKEDRQHKGRGPRNYKRSDERIKEDINDRLSDDWFIDASDIDVAVQNGEVTLTGTVDERTSKRRAEDIAEAVSGVSHVENRIRVGSTNKISASTSESNYGSSTTGSSSTGATGTSKTSRQSGLVTDAKSS